MNTFFSDNNLLWWIIKLFKLLSLMQLKKTNEKCWVQILGQKYAYIGRRK